MGSHNIMELPAFLNENCGLNLLSFPRPGWRRDPIRESIFLVTTRRSRSMFRALLTAVILIAVPALAQTAGPATWKNDLSPIAASDWNYDFAAHLLERAGFGGTPEEIQALAKMTPAQAIARLVRFEGADASQLPRFDHSGILDPGIQPFPPSRPAVTKMAKEQGEALGIKVKPAGNR